MSKQNQITYWKFLIWASLFAFQYSVSQSQIQNEPEKLFTLPSNVINNREFVVKYSIEKILFLRDTILSASREFDRRGNEISSLMMDNDEARKTISKFDYDNNMVEIRFYKPNDSLSYGYYFTKINDTVSSYDITDSIVKQKIIRSKDGASNTFLQYRNNGDLYIHMTINYDEQERIILESNYDNKNRLDYQYRYERIDGDTYVSKVNYDKLGNEKTVERYLDERMSMDGTQLIRYRKHDQGISEIVLFKDEDVPIKIEKFDNDDKLYYTEILKYDKQNRLLTRIAEDLIVKKQVVYEYIYDKRGFLKSIYITTGNTTEKFIYRYITFQE